MFRRAAAGLCGLSEISVSYWYRTGAKSSSGRYHDFYVAVSEAEAIAARLKLRKPKKSYPSSRRPRNGDLLHDIAVAVLDIYERGAWERGHSWELLDAEALMLMSRPCHYCGLPPSNERRRRTAIFRFSGLDRMDNTQGYARQNVVPCCSGCNRAKGVDSYEGFLARIRRIYERQQNGSTPEKVLETAPI